MKKKIPKKQKKPKIIYPVYKNMFSPDDKIPIKEGSIDGVPLSKVWKECQRYAKKYFNDKVKGDLVFKRLVEEDDIK